MKWLRIYGAVVVTLGLATAAYSNGLSPGGGSGKGGDGASKGFDPAPSASPPACRPMDDTSYKPAAHTSQEQASAVKPASVQKSSATPKAAPAPACCDSAVCCPTKKHGLFSGGLFGGMGWHGYKCCPCYATFIDAGRLLAKRKECDSLHRLGGFGGVFTRCGYPCRERDEDEKDKDGHKCCVPKGPHGKFSGLFGGPAHKCCGSGGLFDGLGGLFGGHGQKCCGSGGLFDGWGDLFSGHRHKGRGVGPLFGGHAHQCCSSPGLSGGAGSLFGTPACCGKGGPLDGLRGLFSGHGRKCCGSKGVFGGMRDRFGVRGKKSCAASGCCKPSPAEPVVSRHRGPYSIPEPDMGETVSHRPASPEDPQAYFPSRMRHKLASQPSVSRNRISELFNVFDRD